jgi:hypothetical protein
MAWILFLDHQAKSETMGKRGPRGRNWTVEERVIIYEMARDGRGVFEVNARLDAYQRQLGLSTREIPPKSYEIIEKSYAPYFRSETSLRALARKPLPMGKLRHTAG